MNLAVETSHLINCVGNTHGIVFIE